MGKLIRLQIWSMAIIFYPPPPPPPPPHTHTHPPKKKSIHPFMLIFSGGRLLAWNIKYYSLRKTNKKIIWNCPSDFYPGRKAWKFNINQKASSRQISYNSWSRSKTTLQHVSRSYNLSSSRLLYLSDNYCPFNITWKDAFVHFLSAVIF